MPMWSAGKTTKRGEAGVTLIEMLIVVTLVALMAGLSYPSVSSGLETLRLRSTSDAIVGLLDTSVERATRRQQPVEIQISQKDGTLVARSADAQFSRRVDIPKPLAITDILPHVPADAGDARRVIIYPGGAAPRIGIELSTPSGRKRTVQVDPITGVAQAQ
jgi:prepilin-type N-terminal cleavage/methylation domain-containing protein